MHESQNTYLTGYRMERRMRTLSSRDIARSFVPLALGLTVVLFVSYANDQQILREDANAPQQGIAQDIARELDTNPTAVIPAEARIPIESSLSPYFVVFDAYGTPVVGTGYLHDRS